MKKLLVACALAAAAVAVPAVAQVGVSITVGEPGFYGRLDVGGYQPRVIYREPVVVERYYRNQTPIYVRVPPGHQKNWNRIAAVTSVRSPVYFVRDECTGCLFTALPPLHGRDALDNRRDDRHDRREIGGMIVATTAGTTAAAHR